MFEIEAIKIFYYIDDLYHLFLYYISIYLYSMIFIVMLIAFDWLNLIYRQYLIKIKDFFKNIL